MNVGLCVTPPDNAAFRSEFTTGRRAAAAGGRQDRSGLLQMRRSTSMTPQSAAGSGVCPLQEPEGEIVLEFRTVPQASPLSLSAGVSLDPLVVEDPGVRRASRTHPAADPTGRCRDRAHRAPAERMIRCGDNGKARGANRYRGRCRPQSEGIPSQGRPCHGAADRGPSGFPPTRMDGRVAATGRVRHACFSGWRPAAFSRGNTQDPVACRGELRGTAALTGGTPRCGCTGASRQRDVGSEGRNVTGNRRAFRR